MVGAALLGKKGGILAAFRVGCTELVSTKSSMRELGNRLEVCRDAGGKPLWQGRFGE